MDKFSYGIGRLSGVLEGFAFVNNKVNHDFSFHIDILDSDKAIEDSIANHLKVSNQDQLTFNPIDEWRVALTHQLKNWLFCYQQQIDKEGNAIDGGCGSYFSYLKDTDNSFNMSDIDFKEEFLEAFCDALDACLNVTQAITVHLKTNKWYEASWNDIAIKGKNGNVFIHFGVSD